MTNIFHFSAIVLGFLAYAFSDVNSNNGFTSLLMPIIVVISFIYGVIVTIGIFKKKNATEENAKSTDFLLENMKVLKEKPATNDKVTDTNP